MSSSAAANGQTPIILDLGTKSKKQIKRLRKLEGKLAGVVDEAIKELYVSGSMADGTQPVLLIVREGPKKLKIEDVVAAVVGA